MVMPTDVNRMIHKLSNTTLTVALTMAKLPQHNVGQTETKTEHTEETVVQHQSG